MKRPYFVFVGGINSSGKSTILKKNVNKEIVYISGSSYFMKWLGIEKGEYSKLQSLSDKKALRELGKMMHYLVKKEKFRNGTKIVCIDAHYLNIRNGEAKAYIGNWLRLMNGFVLIKSSPKNMLKWMERDLEKNGRERNLFKPHSTQREKLTQLNLFIRENIRLFKKLSLLYKKPNKIINNTTEVRNAVKSLKLFINKQIKLKI